MALADFVQTVESEWQPDMGFFWKVRQGVFDKSDFNRAHSQVAPVPSQDGKLLPARLVSLPWYIRIFMCCCRFEVQPAPRIRGPVLFVAGILEAAHVNRSRI